MAASATLSIAGAGLVFRFRGEFSHVRSNYSSRSRKVLLSPSMSPHNLPHYKSLSRMDTSNSFTFRLRNSPKRYAFSKEADDASRSNVDEDTDAMFDDLFNKYGKVVFKRNDQKPPSAEVDDDAESLSFVLAMAKVASDVKAADIKIDAIASRMKDLAEKDYKKIPSGDSKPNSWTLLDFGDVVVHIFLPEQRSFYNLEEFYANATIVELPFENQPPFGR